MKAGPVNRKEAWDTPQLRILSVPAQTQSGVYAIADVEDEIFYGLS